MKIDHPMRRGAAAALAAAALLVATAGTAAAASPPKASTGSARGVSYNTATLNGSVNPDGSATSYYFQFGPTKAYGGQSAIGGTNDGTATVPVAETIAGLQPLTVYHYRLVAVSAAGTAFGGDRTFQTAKVPLSLALLVSPDPAPFGAATVVQGTLSGTGNGGRPVALQADPWPFTAGFQTVGNPQVTSAAGGFSFTVLGAAQITQWRVVTTTKPVIVSPVATQNVAVIVSSHVARTRRRGYARIYGTVTPAENGAQVGILRIVHGHGVLVGGTVLRPDGATRSSFSRVVRVERGVYRVLARVVGVGQVSSYGQPLAIR